MDARGHHVAAWAMPASSTQAADQSFLRNLRYVEFLPY